MCAVENNHNTLAEKQTALSTRNWLLAILVNSILPTRKIKLDSMVCFSPTSQKP